MFSKAMPRLALLLVFFAQSARAKDQATLVPTINSFFETWLIQRDADAAMRYFSNKPVLGECCRIPSQIGKRNASPQEFRWEIKSLLSLILEHAPKAKRVETLIRPVDIVPSGELSVEGQPYDLFSLKEFKGARFICKFDESKSFREEFEHPNVWYSTFSMGETKWIFAWISESDNWRILSLGPLED